MSAGLEDLKINAPEPSEPGDELLGDGVVVEIEPPLWQLAWRRFLRRMDRFRRWADPEVDPAHDPGMDRERGLVPVAGLFALALAAQYGQFYVPYVSEFLLTHDIRQRMAWMGFFLFKQWALFVLILLALALKEKRLDSIGFPAMTRFRFALAGGLVVAALLAALFNLPRFSPLEAYLNWMLPAAPGERALSVLVAGTAAVVEETFFRGFAIVWLYRWSGSVTLAVVFPALIFSAGHSYIGWANVPFAFAAALAFSLLFLWKRDLYWPMVLHFAINSIDLFRV